MTMQTKKQIESMMKDYQDRIDSFNIIISKIEEEIRVYRHNFEIEDAKKSHCELSVVLAKKDLCSIVIKDLENLI